MAPHHRILEQFVEPEDARAQPVIDVVIVIGNVVGERGDLRLEARPAAEREVPVVVRLAKRPARRRHRPIVLGQPLERLPAEVEPVEAGIGCLEPRDDADGMLVMIEPAGIGERRVERILAAMAERRMAKVVAEAQHFGQIFVEAERAGDGAADLRDFEAVRQPDAVMVAVGRDEHLGLVAQAAEGDRMDDPVAVALEDVAGAARAAIAFVMPAAARAPGAGGNSRRKAHSVPSGTILSEAELVQLKASTPMVPRSSAKISASPRPRNGPMTRRDFSPLLAT